MARRTAYGNAWSENGWPMVDRGSCAWITVPGSDGVRLEIQTGPPTALLTAWAADWNAFIERLRDADSACWTDGNSVATSNHLSGTALDLNWDNHPFHNRGSLNADQMRTLKEMEDFYEGTVFWAGRWDDPVDEMHSQVGYNTYDRAADRPQQRVLDFISRKIRADGYSTFRRGPMTGTPPTPAQPPVKPPAPAGERVLNYDRNVVPQETGYWCGPASTQVVLNARGIVVPERDLAAAIGTHTGGTDHVGLIERELDRRVPQAGYTTVLLPNDPITQPQKDQLWRDIVRSIDAGYGVVMNWVAPPGNYPRGVKGSPNPSYGGGTVFHYVACMGYDAANAAVWIADSGFRPFGYWISFDQCATLIPPKGYAYATVGAAAPAPAPAPAPVPVAPRAGAQVLAGAMLDRLTLDRYEQLLPAVTASLRACDCTNVNRIAMWCAQIGHESGGLFYTEEIASGAAYEGRGDLGNTQPGDGVRFKGRSWIQITGRSNYLALSRWAFAKGLVPSPTFFVDNPAELSSDRYAGLGAAWYWVVARSDINALSDRRDLDTVTRRINGGLNGLDDRRNRYNKALSLGDRLLTLITSGEEEFLSALNADEQREVLNLLRWVAAPETGELRKMFADRSMYRTTNAPTDTLAGKALTDNAFGWDQRVESSALRGEAWAIVLVAQAASGLLPGVRKADGTPDVFLVRHALSVLAEIESTNKTALQSYIDATKGKA